MQQYVFAEDEPLPIKNRKKADPQKLGELFAATLGKSGERTNKELDELIEAARKPRHVLHPHLEWDDAIAGQEHRREQCRRIIRQIRIVREDDTPRAFHSVKIEGVRRSYQPIDVVQNSVDMQVALLRSADRELAAMQRRFSMLREICSDVADLREKISKRIADQQSVAASAA